MPVTAHIGNIPVEEWLPFLVPVVALYFFVRRKERRRRERVRRLLDGGGQLDAETTSAVLASWAATDHEDVSPEQLPLLYPPGPDGMTAAELATRIHRDTATVQRQLEDLAELGYLELDQGEPPQARRAWLTAVGSDLVNLTEDALLASLPAEVDAEARDRSA
jgi:predicted transcriptional regulator